MAYLASDQVICLPMHANLSCADVDEIVNIICV